MANLKENKAREHRIEMEAVVDAYNSEERAMGWYYYLEERLKFPFKARCKSKREISPLRVGEDAQLKPQGADATTREAVADWHYSVARGYQF